MLNWIKNKWHWFSNLGVKENMTLSLQRRIILCNRIALLLFVLLMGSTLSEIDQFSVEQIPSFLSILSIWLVPFMNKRGNYHSSAFLISFLTSTFSFIFSISAMQQVHNITNYIAPRLNLLAMLIIPFIVIDKSRKDLQYIALIFNIMYIFIFDFVLKYFHLEFDPQKVNFSDYPNINYYIIPGVILIVLGMYFLNRINDKYEDRILFLLKEVKEKNEELEQQKVTIQKALSTIETKNKKITDSITYAQRIQNAFLPGNVVISEMLPNSFVLFKPKDIVSGDFYWAYQNAEFKVIVVADCTGHGVPGALLSILGITLLNESVIHKKIFQPNVLLNELRSNVKNILNQYSVEQQNDGMDISVCIWNTKNNEISFAGAFNSMIVIRNNEIFELKADKQPVGIYYNERDFSIKHFELKQNDMVYMYSDGFQSQFGGENAEKLSSKRFKSILCGYAELEPIEQKIELESFIQKWQGQLEQTDDILVLGFRV